MKASRKETIEEQIERFKPVLGARILAGVIHIENQNAFFEVWAYRKLTDAEMLRHWNIYRKQNGKKSIRGMTLRVVSNSGKAIR